MGSDPPLIEYPGYKKKTEKLNTLKAELAHLISQRDILENTVGKNLLAIYATKIGKNEYILFRTRHEVERLKRKIELFQARLNHGKRFDIQEVESKLDKEYIKWKKEMSRMLEDIEKARKRLGSLMDEKESKQLQELYRFLVKRLHPDINNDPAERTKLLWHRTMEAYSISDLEELKAIKLLTEDIVDKDPDCSLQDMDKKIEDVSAKVIRLIQYIKKIKSEFPFTIEDLICDKSWVSEKNTEILKEIESFESKKTELKVLIERLILQNMQLPEKRTIN